MPALNNGEPGNTIAIFNEEEKWLCMERGAVTVACNLAQSSRALAVPDRGKLILASNLDVKIDAGKIALPPDSVAIISAQAQT